MKNKKLILLLLISSSLIFSQSWVKVGNDIDAKDGLENLGYSVSLSSDGNRVAIGAPGQITGSIPDMPGYARVYSEAGEVWTQVGGDIVGEATLDHFGYSVSLSLDGKRVAVGTWGKYVRIYSESGGIWTQIGSNIDGGFISVSLSSDGKRVAVGNSVGNYARIYSESGGVWTQVGSDIDGDGAVDAFGRSVSLSSDGKRIAIGAITIWLGTPIGGHVRVYSESSGVWTQIGEKFELKSQSVSLSSDGKRVAIGTGTLNYIRIYSESGGTWTQVGSEIASEGGSNEGTSVSLSSDGKRVAIGKMYAVSTGQTRIYQESDGEWSQLGGDINGEATNDWSGNSVSLSSNGKRVAVGAIGSDRIGFNGGVVRAYDLEVGELIIDGSAYYENQDTHENIGINFERTAPNSRLYATHTANSGYYSINIDAGIYDITYSKDGFDTESISNQIFSSNTTLPNITLLEHKTLINVPGDFTTIQMAIDYAWNGDTILVSPGTYVENINFNGKRIIVASLMLTTDNLSYITQTIIDGNQNGHVVEFSNYEKNNSILQGFTIQNGKVYGENGGGGIYCYQANPILKNLIVTNNYAFNEGIINNGFGGGMSFWGSGAIITNVVIKDNSAGAQGGGIYCSNSEIKFTNAIISENSSDNVGGGAYIISSEYTFDNVVICRNTALAGSAIVAAGSSIITLVNSIVSNNSGIASIWLTIGSEISSSFSNFWNNEGGSLNDLLGGLYGINSTTNANGTDCDVYYNIQENPLFVDNDNDDFHLDNWSKLIGAGTMSVNTSNIDIDGNPRPMPAGTNPDIGSYENKYPKPMECNSGSIIYNTETGAFNFCENGYWVEK